MKKGVRNYLLGYPRGIYDLNETQYKKYLEILRVLENISKTYAFENVKTGPLLYSDLSGFTKAAKGKIYEIKSLNQSNVALSSDSTISLLRFYHANHYSSFKKLSSNVEIFRRNKKRREFSQFCFEIIGAENSEEVDINILLTLNQVISKLKPEATVIVNDFKIWEYVLHEYNDYKEVLYNIRKQPNPLEYVINSFKLPTKLIEFLTFTYENQKLTLQEMIDYCEKYDLKTFSNRFVRLKQTILMLRLHLNLKFNFFDFRGSEIFINRYYKCLDKGGHPFLDGGNDSDYSSRILGDNYNCGGVAICLEAMIDDYEIKKMLKKALVKINNISIIAFYSLLEKIRNYGPSEIIFFEDSTNSSVSKSKKRAYRENYDYFIVVGINEIDKEIIEIENLITHDKEKLVWGKEYEKNN